MSTPARLALDPPLTLDYSSHDGAIISIHSLNIARGRAVPSMLLTAEVPAVALRETLRYMDDDEVSRLLATARTFCEEHRVSELDVMKFQLALTSATLRIQPTRHSASRHPPRYCLAGMQDSALSRQR